MDFSLSFAKFYAKFRRVKSHIIKYLRNSAINQRASARKQKLRNRNSGVNANLLKKREKYSKNGCSIDQATVWNYWE